jgi:hypothetical protein
MMRAATLVAVLGATAALAGCRGSDPAGPATDDVTVLDGAPFPITPFDLTTDPTISCS